MWRLLDEHATEGLRYRVQLRNRTQVRPIQRKQTTYNTKLTRGFELSFNHRTLP